MEWRVGGGGGKGMVNIPEILYQNCIHRTLTNSEHILLILKTKNLPPKELLLMLHHKIMKLTYSFLLFHMCPLIGSKHNAEEKILDQIRRRDLRPRVKWLRRPTRK